MCVTMVVMVLVKLPVLVIVVDVVPVSMVHRKVVHILKLCCTLLAHNVPSLYLLVVNRFVCFVVCVVVVAGDLVVADVTAIESRCDFPIHNEH